MSLYVLRSNRIGNGDHPHETSLDNLHARQIGSEGEVLLCSEEQKGCGIVLYTLDQRITSVEREREGKARYPIQMIIAALTSWYNLMMFVERNTGHQLRGRLTSEEL